MVAWSQNDKLFKELLSEGHSWQALPYVFLSLSGFEVEMPDLSVREDISKAGAWLETYDLRIGNLNIEVKSRPFAFTSARDWPNNRLPAFLDTTKKWNAKSKKPFAYIFISKPTGCMVATCATTGAEKRWAKTRQFDRTRKIYEEFYTVGGEHLVGMDVLVNAIRRELNVR